MRAASRGASGHGPRASPCARRQEESLAEPKVVIVIPSQGHDLNGFLSTALALDSKVYGGDALIVKTTVTRLGDTYDVVFRAIADENVTFAGRKGLTRVITVSHSWTRDGPNLANGAGGHKPWGTVGNEGNELTGQGQGFWREVAQRWRRAAGSSSSAA